MSDFKQEVVEKLLHNTFNEANIPSDWHKPEEQANLAIGVILSKQEKKKLILLIVWKVIQSAKRKLPRTLIMVSRLCAVQLISLLPA